MSIAYCLTFTCLCKHENDQVKPFCMSYRGKEYTIIFKW